MTEGVSRGLSSLISGLLLLGSSPDVNWIEELGLEECQRSFHLDSDLLLLRSSPEVDLIEELVLKGFPEVFLA